MPLYEYECHDCGRRTEVLQRLDEAPLAICPHCGGRLRKLFSAPSFQFKGSGWYVTDYARKSGGEESAAGQSGTEKGEKGDKGAGAAPAGADAPAKSEAAAKSAAAEGAAASAKADASPPTAKKGASED